MHTYQDNTISLFFAGDLCVKQPISENYIANSLSTKIKNHDYRVVNWEAPIIRQNASKINKAGPHIHQDDSSKHILKSGLFNVFSLANNHIMDYGLSELENTQTILANYGQTLGASHNDIKKTYEPLILTKNNVSVALFSIGEAQFGCQKSSEQKGGYAWIYSNEIFKQIKAIKPKVDYIICLPHAGLEMAELPLPEWRMCYKQLIDFGADLVIASHPHVIQPKEKYNGKWIYYSLGNFLFNTESNDKRWNNSLGLSCEFNANGEIKIDECFLQLLDNQIISSEDGTSFKLNNDILQNEEIYTKQINAICLKAWNDYYESYYLYGVQSKYNASSDKQKNPIRKIASKIRGKFTQNEEIKNQTLLYHNISIETHRYCVERALRLLNNIE